MSFRKMLNFFESLSCLGPRSKSKQPLYQYIIATPKDALYIKGEGKTDEELQEELKKCYQTIINEKIVDFAFTSAHLSIKSATTFSDILKQQTTLKEFNFGGELINDDALKRLAEGMVSNKYLQNFSVTIGKSVSEKGLIKFAGTVAKQCSFTNSNLANFINSFLPSNVLNAVNLFLYLISTRNSKIMYAKSLLRKTDIYNDFAKDWNNLLQLDSQEKFYAAYLLLFEKWELSLISKGKDAVMVQSNQFDWLVHKSDLIISPEAKAVPPLKEICLLWMVKNRPGLSTHSLPETLQTEVELSRRSHP
jgi:hypothetical protein